MFNKLLKWFFLSYFKKNSQGSLTLYLPDGSSLIYQAKLSGYDAQIIIKSWWVFVHAIARGNIGLAADYRDGLWDTDNLEHLLLFGAYNNNLLQHYSSSLFLFKWCSRVLYWFHRNTMKQSKKNIHDHYDLGNNFYKLWLDETMTYSSAMFLGSDDIEYKDRLVLKQGQINKYNFILDQLELNNVDCLEIGCGWGGFAELLLNRSESVSYTGCTLSEEQNKIALDKVKPFGSRASVIVADYRQLKGSYDYIVSIEMLEAVGREYWNSYFQTIKNRLKSNGTAFIQTIVIKDEFFAEYVKRDDMIRTFIFPGGILPCISVLREHLNSCNLYCEDIHHFGLDYANTLRAWLWNFDLARDSVKFQGFDDEFVRLWRFYLSFCIAGFVSKRIDVIMMKISHKN